MDELGMHIVVRSWSEGTSLGGILRAPSEVSGLVARVTVSVPTTSKFLLRHRGATLVVEAGTDEDALYNAFNMNALIARGISRPGLFTASSSNENQCCALYTADDLGRRPGTYSPTIFLNPPWGSTRPADAVANDLIGEIRKLLGAGTLLGLLTLCAFAIDGVVVVAMEWESADAHHDFPRVLSESLRDLGFTRNQIAVELPPPQDRIVNFLYVARPGVRFGLG